MKITTLTVDTGQSIVTTLHDSEEAAARALRVNYDAEGRLTDEDDGDMIQSLIDRQGLVIYIETHEHKINVEILHVRDPDSACSVSTWVNGELAVTHAHVEDIDAGRGWPKEDWDDNVRSIEERETYSPDFKAAVLDAMADPPGNEHIR